MKLSTFVDYVKSFYYGSDALYPYPWTEDQIVEGCYQQMHSDAWGDGDSFDRELVREYLISKYGE